MALPIPTNQEGSQRCPYRWDYVSSFTKVAMTLVAIAPLIFIAPVMQRRSDTNNASFSNYAPITTTMTDPTTSMNPGNRSQLANLTLVNLMNKSEVVTCNSSSSSSCTVNISFVPQCGVVENVIESTSSLLVATGLTKADNITLRTYNMWYYFNALFAVPTAGFLPKYSYLIHPDDHDADVVFKETKYYMADTRIPSLNMFFNHNLTKLPLPCDDFKQKEPSICWIGSGRISTTPFHGTALLELILSLERQHQTISHGQLGTIYRYWDRIFAYHEYLHDIVMRGCHRKGEGNRTSHDYPPCYNIIHPWESMISIQSSFWKETLEPTIFAMTENNWEVPFDIPKQVKQSYDYDEDIYAATIFLAECLSNQTHNESSGDLYPYQFRQDAAFYEDEIIRHCPFAMLDVGFASALAQSDDDLRRVALWLRQRGVASPTSLDSRSLDSKMQKFVKWRKQSRFVMDLLWNQHEQSFLSRYALPKQDGDYPPTTEHARTPVANNLMVFWQQLHGEDEDEFGKRWDSESDDRMRQMAQSMLRHNGKLSFDCPGFPLWSGGCNDRKSIVDPILNFFVGLGLLRNQESLLVFGDYLTNATIDLILQNASATSATAVNVTFQEAYPASDSSSYFALDQCGSTSTATSMIFYQLLLDDFDFSFQLFDPPIRNSWILTLISVELIIAFAVGVSCICLSLSLVRQENGQSEQQDDLGVAGADGSYLAVDAGADDDESDSMPGLLQNSYD